jgi:hypothetical protein
VKKAMIDSSRFKSCSSSTVGDLMGGSVDYASITTTILLKSCEIRESVCHSDGGGMSIHSCKASIEDAILLSSFVSCHLVEGSTPRGGGIIHWGPSSKINFRSCLFLSCFAFQYGGGMRIGLSSTNQGTLLFYSFFNKNTIGSGVSGVDIALSLNSIPVSKDFFSLLFFSFRRK